MQNPFGPADFADCIGIVDGVYFRVERPKDAKLERRLYSTYKKYHSVFFLVIIDRRGTSPQHGKRSQLLKQTIIDLFAICLSGRIHTLR